MVENIDVNHRGIKPLKFVVWFLLTTFLLSSCKSSKLNPLTQTNEAEWVAWFNSFNPQWKAAVEQKDPSYILAQYEEDAVIGVPGKGFIKGQAAIENYWTNLVGQIDSFSYQTLKVGGDPNTILYENGLGFVTYTIDNKQVTDTTKYLFVWKHVGDKKYKVLSEMFNTIK